MPPILSTSKCEFNGTVRAPMLKKPSPWHLFTRLLNKWYLQCIHYTSFLHVLYKLLPPNKNILGARHFFSVSLFHFHHTLFRGLAGARVNPGSIFSNSLFVHSLVCLITHSFLNGFQPNLYQHFSHVCSTCLAIFSLK